jgi:putative protease
MVLKFLWRNIMKKIELLAPAKNYEYGKQAVNHGADAVYIGAQNFGARQNASNSLKEIEKLIDYAHKFNAKVYIAFNTILFDHELEKAQKLIEQIWNTGSDALIIQDMGILKLDIPAIPLFASTQTDNRDPEKIKFLENAGFERIILARELSVEKIKEISKHTNADLEAFVHGALCVSFSGRCYLSHLLGKRSANRGNCGQPCRLKWNLYDNDGKLISQNRHLLSLKDMDRSKALEQMIDAGISSFKIEGRLKDLSYVKNITGYYRKKLDEIFNQRSDLKPASSGKTNLLFTPVPSKTFSRGSCEYFLNGKRENIESFDTPKSIGEEIGIIEKIDKDNFTLKTGLKISNGDGLCYFDENFNLKGIKVNRAENKKIYPKPGTNLKKLSFLKGKKIYRNYDQEFLKTLAGKSSERKIGISLVFKETDFGFILEAKDEDKIKTSVFLETEKISAEKQELFFSAIETKLSKLGDSDFYLKSFKIESKPYFIQAKKLKVLRRELLEQAMNKRKKLYEHKTGKINKDINFAFPESGLDYTYNVSNKKSREFYMEHNVINIEPALEIKKPQPPFFVMNTKHCIRYSLGICLKDKKNSFKEPLFLENEKGRFEIKFDCKNCEMLLYPVFS